MAEITVDCYKCGGYKPNGTVTITPRANGYEWTKNTDKYTQKLYCPTFNHKELGVILSKDETLATGERSWEEGGEKMREAVRTARIGANSFFRNILTNPSDFTPICFTKADALKLYDFFAEQMEWSPDALATGTAHPDLLAAKARHSAAGRGGGTRRKRRM
jgi:hypothetical protein